VLIRDQISERQQVMINRGRHAEQESRVVIELVRRCAAFQAGRSAGKRELAVEAVGILEMIVFLMPEFRAETQIGLLLRPRKVHSVLELVIVVEERSPAGVVGGADR